MRGLAIGGFTQTIVDVENEFNFLAGLPAIMEYQTWDTFAPMNLMGVDFTIAYSYGQADMWH